MALREIPEMSGPVVNLRPGALVILTSAKLPEEALQDALDRICGEWWELSQRDRESRERLVDAAGQVQAAVDACKRLLDVSAGYEQRSREQGAAVSRLVDRAEASIAVVPLSRWQRVRWLASGCLVGLVLADLLPW